MKQKSVENFSIKKFAVIMRTCDLISPKYPFPSKLIENKKFHYENIKNYATVNKAKLYIICDTKNEDFFQFVNNTFDDKATVIRSYFCSNSESFKVQIELAKNLQHDFIEIAEDDFIKFGKIDWSRINSNYFYTAYQHPLHDRPIYKMLMRIFENEFTTVCSFLCNRRLLIKNIGNFLRFGVISDAETWRTITTPWWLQFLFNIKNGKFGCNFGKKSRIHRIPNVTWIHVAKDSLPKAFEYIKELNFKTFKKDMEFLVERENLSHR